MTAALIGMGISGVSVLVLALLFRIERGRAARLGEGARTRFDATAEKLFVTIGRAGKYLARDVFRQSLHYVVHILLRGVEHIMSYVLRIVDRLQHTNKTLARRAKEGKAERTKLDELTAHKEETSLSEDERKAHKEESVGTRL